jgi:hypothetical protein
LEIHPEWQPNYYMNQNKRLIKAIEADYASANTHMEISQKLHQAHDTWKMRRFTENAKPRV